MPSAARTRHDFESPFPAPFPLVNLLTSAQTCANRFAAEHMVDTEHLGRVYLYHATTIRSYLKYYTQCKGRLPELQFGASTSQWDKQCGGELGAGLYTSTFEGTLPYIVLQPRPQDYVILEIDVTNCLNRAMGVGIPNDRTCQKERPDNNRYLAEADLNFHFLTNDWSQNEVREKFRAPSHTRTNIPQIKLTQRFVNDFHSDVKIRPILFNGFFARVPEVTHHGGGMKKKPPPRRPRTAKA